MSQPTLSIPTPCHENWNEMSPVEKGRFCASCEKTVHDFTKSSDSHIISVLRTSQNICGRFLESQLERELADPKRLSGQWAIAASGILGMFSMASAQAQQIGKPASVILVGDAFEDVQDQRVKIGEVTPETVVVSGIISDGEAPLHGATVKVLGTGTEARTLSDGKYSIEANWGQTLEIKSFGYEDGYIKVGSAEKYDIILQLEQVSQVQNCMTVSGDVRVIEKPSIIRRTYDKITKKRKK